MVLATDIRNPYLNGTPRPAPEPPASVIKIGSRDPSIGKIDWAPPGEGKYLIPHADTFMNRYTSLSATYRNPDEAVMDSLQNARNMLTDLGVRECLDSRIRSVALLDWNIDTGKKKPTRSDEEFCTTLTDTITRIPSFFQYRLWAQWAIWFGKVGIEHHWGVQNVDNKSVYMPTSRHQDDMGWKPIHGDKLVFRQFRMHDQMPAGGYEGQLGIKVGMYADFEKDRKWKAGDEIGSGSRRWKIEPTDFGMAYFLSPAERRLILVHKHNVQDAAYEDGLRAGLVYGEGIRSVVYWEWFQKQKLMGFMMEYIERMAGGIQVWRFPKGDKQAEDAAKKAAEGFDSMQQHVVLMPVPPGDNGQYGIDIVEPGFGGVEVLHSLLKEYFGNRVKRYIMGQIMTSEAEATGMGSGVAELHQDTYLQILKSDAINTEETFSRDLVGTLIKVNVERKVWADPGFTPRFVLQSEEPDIEARSQSWLSWAQVGLPFEKEPIYEMLGANNPPPGADVFQVQQGGGGEGGPEGMPPGAGPEGGEGDKPPNEPDRGIADHKQPTEPGDKPVEKNEAKPESLHRYSKGKPFMKTAFRVGQKR